MNALTIRQPTSEKPAISPQPKPALIEWLRRDEPAAEMAATLIRSGRVGALEEAIPALRDAATEEAGEAGVKAVLTAAFVHFPQPERVPAEWNVFWQGYVGTCGHLAKTAVQAGMMRWLADPESRFLPQPGQLRAFATQSPTEEHRVLNKARMVLEAVRAEETRQRLAADHAARGTDAAKQAKVVRDMLAGVGSELLATAAKQRDAMKRKGIAHANRCVRPEGELTETQITVLRQCGVE